MAELLGVAIIGCGDMGRKHAAAWDACSDAQVVVVCDQHNDSAKDLANRYAANWYERWPDVVSHDGVDIVSICVPACDHHDVAVAAASAGKHVLCEKPMALTLDQADQMIAAAAANNVHLSVCHQYRGMSRFRTMKRLIDQGRLGEPVYMRFSEMREVRPKLAMHSLSVSGGPVHDMTGHLFDLARFLTDSEAETVSAVGTIFGRGKDRLETVSDFGIDTAEILVRFRGGHCLSIGMSWGLPENTPGHCQELIYGPLGMTYSDDVGPSRYLGDLSETVGVVIKDAHGTTRLECENDHDGPNACIEELIDTIQNATPSQFDGREGRAALRLILAALNSIETGQVMQLS